MATVDTLWNDFKLALRGFRKRLAFTTAIVVVLALGIGANTAIFSVINAAFQRPLPYEAADDLVHITETSGGHSIPVSFPNYQDWLARAKSFESVGVFANFPMLMRTSGTTQRIQTSFASASLLRTLRVKPFLGRELTAEDDKGAGTPSLILTHEFWSSRFASDPTVIGRKVSLDRLPCVIVGVLPASFDFFAPADAFAPFPLALDRFGMRERANHNNTTVIARLKPGVTIEQARTEMAGIARQLEREYPGINSGIGIMLRPLREAIAGNARSALSMLMGAVAVVLLIACLNVGSLLLVRALSRSKEIAIRTALGATRRQIAQQLLVEAVMLCGAGGLLGISVASLFAAAPVWLAPGAVVGDPVSLDSRVLVFGAAVTVGTGLLFGLVPIIHVFRLDLNDAIRDGGRTTSSTGHVKIQNVLVTAEVALSVALLAGAGLLLRSFYNLLHVHPGYRTDTILSVRVSLPDSEEIRLAQYPVYFERLLAYTRTLPGVEQAGGVMMMPFTGENSNMTFYVEGKAIPDKSRLPSADRHVVTPEYFQTMGIPLIRGRIFNDADGRIPDISRDEAMKFFRAFPFTVVISETMAKRHWPNEDPVGRRFRVGPPEFRGPWLTVIGVVGDTKHRSLSDAPSPAFYFPSQQIPSTSFNLVIRTAAAPAGLIPAILREAARLHADAALTDVRTVGSLIEKHVANRKMNLYLVGMFAGMALLLAAVGVYGVIAYSVAQRTHEIGIRMALGATETRVVSLVLSHGLAIGGAGLLLGLGMAASLSRFIASMLYGVAPLDVDSLGSVASVLGVVVLLAGWLPARRASLIDPLTALRSD
jgi:putative ABC transport system permease protein